MLYLLYVIHVITCIFLILVVLLQQGKGADLSVFGGGTTMTAFGARSATTLLHRLTVGAFVAFILTTVVISFLQGRPEVGSVMTGEAVESAPVETPAPAPIPEGTPAPVPSPEATQPEAPAAGQPEAAAPPESAPSEAQPATPPAGS